jgi:two-component system response regulator AtoC
MVPESAEQPTVLVCDDDGLIRWSIATHLRDAGYEVLEACHGVEALELVQEHSPSCVVLDLAMPVMDGLVALQNLREQGHEVPVIVITATGGVDSAITATKLGASGYLQKPLDPREVGLAVQKSLAEDRLKREVTVLRDRQRTGYGEFIGRSDALNPLFADLRRLEGISAPMVLLMGESGTGKDVVARTIHARGPRKDAMFVEIDCTSLPEQLMESELFGYEKGAFTDAKQAKRGLFEVASGGVVFLDEIGELPLSLQAKLLRALENRTFKRLGGLANLKLDAGVIAATNRDLKKEVAAGRFREDLYYRLHVVTLKLPPLRERRDDIPQLVTHFLGRFNQQFGRQIESVDGETMELLCAYDWPGNVRELKNVLERIVILGTDGLLSPTELPTEIRFSPRTPTPPPSPSDFPFVLPEGGVDLEQVERDFLVQALARTQGNQTAAAKLLNLSRFQLRNRIQKFGI